MVVIKAGVVCGILIIGLLTIPCRAQLYYNDIEIPIEKISDSVIVTVDSVSIAGNFKTKDYILLRELYFNPPADISLKELALAQKRLLNLYLFNRVIFNLIDDDSRMVLLIQVAEQWYIFPLPILYLNERSWNKVSYGANLAYYNFLGRDITLNFTLAFGYNPEMRLSFRNPWFGGPLKLITSVAFYHKKVRSQNLQYRSLDDERTGFDWLLGRRFGHFFSTYITIGYLALSQPELAKSPTGTDRLTVFSLNARYDNRDLRAYPHEGMDIHFWIKRVQFREPAVYYRYGSRWRQYIPFGPHVTLAVRTEANFAHGNIPLYDRAFLGYNNRIRGEFYTRYEGENLLIGGLELRFPISKIRYFDLPELAPPGFENYYRNLKFGLSAGVFYDAGAVWFQSEQLSNRHIHDGMGVGLHIHLPYVDLFRLELAFDRKLNHQFIGEIGVAF